MFNNIRKIIKEETQEEKDLDLIRKSCNEIGFFDRINTIDANLLHEAHLAKTENCLFITGGN